MKKIAFVAAFAFIFAACGNNSNTETTETEMTSTEHAMPSSNGEQLADGPIDPVCDMVKGDNWEEFSVIDGDTTWFCSPLCKDEFDKDPSKYLSNH